jgi:hypothetical protein
MNRILDYLLWTAYSLLGIGLISVLFGAPVWILYIPNGLGVLGVVLALFLNVNESFTMIREMLKP